MSNFNNTLDELISRKEDQIRVKTEVIERENRVLQDMRIDLEGLMKVKEELKDVNHREQLASRLRSTEQPTVIHPEFEFAQRTASASAEMKNFQGLALHVNDSDQPNQAAAALWWFSKIDWYKDWYVLWGIFMVLWVLFDFFSRLWFPLPGDPPIIVVTRHNGVTRVGGFQINLVLRLVLYALLFSVKIARFSAGQYALAAFVIGRGEAWYHDYMGEIVGFFHRGRVALQKHL